MLAVMALSLAACEGDTIADDRPAGQIRRIQRPAQPPKRPLTSRLDSQPFPATMGRPYAAPQASQVSGVARPAMSQPVAQKAKVAILLPLSGKQAGLGTAMLNAAQLAVFDVAGQDFELMPRDTGTDAAMAVTAMRDAIGSGARLIIGPLFAASVAAVKPVAENSGVNVLALSNDAALAGPGVFIVGFSPAAQVSRVIGFAASRNLRRFAALIPSGAYGDIVAKALNDSVLRQGGEIVTVQRYSPAANAFGPQLAAIAAQKDRIDGLLVAEGGAKLRAIAGQLSAYQIDPSRLRLLGTGLWDEEGLGNVPALIGGWYAAPDSASRARFLTAYEQTYGQQPPRLATLAYDATALAAVLAKRGAGFDRAALTGLNGFSGVDGLFRLNAQGLADRGLAVNQITATGVEQIDVAPASFARLTD